MKDALDFAAINQAALAAFPAVLNRLLPRGKTRRRARLSRSIRAAPIATSDRSRSTDTTGDGATSPPATRAAIRYRLSPTSPMFRKARRRGCWRKCSASKPGGAVMDDASIFAPFSEPSLQPRRKRRAQPRADAPPTFPPADAEPGALAAARLFGRKPDGIWRYADAQAKRLSMLRAGMRRTAKRTFGRSPGVRARAGDFALADHRPLFNLPNSQETPMRP